MCVKVFRHARHDGALARERMIAARDVTEFHGTAVQRRHSANDIFKVHNAGNPTGSALWHESYHARIVLRMHPANVR
jgi:hypothetical protein